MTAIDLSNRLKQLVSTDIDLMFVETTIHINANSKIGNDFVFFRGQYNTLNRQHEMNLITSDDYFLHLDKIRNSIIQRISQITDRDLCENGVTKHKTNNIMSLEIVLDKDYDSFDEEEQEKLLGIIESALKLNSDIKVISKQRGSVKLVVNVTEEDFKKIYKGFMEGKLDEYGISSIKNISTNRVENKIKIQNSEIFAIPNLSYSVYSSFKKSEDTSELIELISLINKEKFKNNYLQKSIIEPGSKMELLFNALLEGKVQTDEEARHLFKEGDDFNLSSLKNRLKEHLLNAIFLLDFKDSNLASRQNAMFECYKNWSAAMILLSRDGKITGIKLLERLLRHTKHFEFTELTLDILRVLRLQYSTIGSNTKRYENVRAQYLEYEKIWQMESKAEFFYSELIAQFSNSKSTSAEVSRRAEEYYSELKPFMDLYSSYNLHFFGRMVHLLIYNIKNDYLKTAELCEDAITFFDKKEYDSNLPLQIFYFNLISCYVILREFEKGQKVIQRYAYLFNEGSFNWFKMQEFSFLLAMRTAHYEDAYLLYNRVTNNPNFNNTQQQILELWSVFGAYIFYIIKVGKIPGMTLNEIPKTYKMGKFTNEIHLFSEDKRALNNSILIIQILYAIAERDINTLLDRIEYIKKYFNRDFNENDSFRIKSFIKILTQIPIANFHSETIAQKAEGYLKRLQQKDTTSTTKTDEIEIIPYESLWEIAIESLKLKVAKRKGNY